MNAAAASEVVIRRLNTADGADYRQVRLTALRLAPDAFGGSFEEDEHRPLAEFEATIRRNRLFGAFARDGRLIGMAGMFVRPGEKLCHKAVMFGMFVDPASRRRGIGRRLVDHVVAEAREVVEDLQLSVAVSNAAAIALYAATGFREYGLEPHALKVGQAYIDEYRMCLALDARNDR